MSIGQFAILIFLSISSYVRAQDSLTFQFESGELKGMIQIEDEMLDGEFRSYFKNGQLKAKGEFSKNQRIGKWVVYDSLGNENSVRFYKNNRYFTSYVQIGPVEKTLDITIVRDLTDNDSTYITQEKDIQFARTIFLEVSQLNSKFRKSLIKTAKNKGYKNERLHGELSDSINWKELSQSLGVLVQFDWIFDSNRNMPHIKMVAFGLYDKSTEEITPTCWVWYPDLRKEFKNRKLRETINEIHELRIPFNCIRIEHPFYKTRFNDKLASPEILFELFDYEHLYWMKNKDL